MTLKDIKQLKKSGRLQAIKDFNRLKWELNERLANKDPEKMKTTHLISLNNLFHSILNRLKQYETKTIK